MKKWRLLHPENLEKQREYNRKWRRINKNYDRNKRSEDVQYRLVKNLRSRLAHAVRRGYKSGSAVKDLGLSVVDFKRYLESKFRLGMTWENWVTAWHIDHVKPLSSFDLSDRTQLLEACHYTNLQPLYVEENLKKGAS